MRPRPTGIERTFRPEDVIVSKTDLNGKITYANRVFLDVSGYTIDEVIGAPHSFIRHPDMPRAVFSLLWETVRSGHEIFAYVNNLTKTGDHYWVFAHVTPSVDGQGQIVGFHSNRRVPDRDALRAITPLYETLLQLERNSDRAAGLRASRAHLEHTLGSMNKSYPEYIFSITREAA